MSRLGDGFLFETGSVAEHARGFPSYVLVGAAYTPATLKCFDLREYRLISVDQ